MRKRWGILLVVVGLACGGHKTAVVDYLKSLDEVGSGLGTISQALPEKLNRFAAEFEKLRHGAPVDLMAALDELKTLHQELVERQQKVDALEPPEPARELHALVQADYAKALETLDAATELVGEGHKAAAIQQGGAGDRVAVLDRIRQLQLRGQELASEGNEILEKEEAERLRLKTEFKLE